MPLADHIVVEIDPLQSIEMRPCLRAAIRLERIWGFPKLQRGIQEGSFLILSAIVRECASKDDAAQILAIRPVGKLINALAPACQSILPALAGHDAAKPDNTASTGKPVPFAEYFTTLFKIATGSNGWTPAEAYAATPAEIVEAMNGRTELLQAIFGSADKINETRLPLYPADDAAVHRAGIARLRELLGSAA